MKDREIVPFQHIPCVMFECLVCKESVQIGQRASNVDSTIEHCKHCDTAYSVAWGSSQDETRVKYEGNH